MAGAKGGARAEQQGWWGPRGPAPSDTHRPELILGRVGVEPRSGCLGDVACRVVIPRLLGRIKLGDGRSLSLVVNQVGHVLAILRRLREACIRVRVRVRVRVRGER